MMTLEHRAFQKSDPLFAYRPFHANGRSFKRGEAFDWQALGIAAEKVELLFRSVMVRHYTAGDPAIDLTNKGLGVKLAENVADPIPAPKRRSARAAA
jgi:hypothetical protein